MSGMAMNLTKGNYVSFGSSGNIQPQEKNSEANKNFPVDLNSESKPDDSQKSDNSFDDKNKQENQNAISIKKSDEIIIKDSKENIVASAIAVKSANSVTYALTDYL